jgi:hypothetical protein
MLDRLLSLLSDEDAWRTALDCVRSAPHPTPRAMSDATLAHYAQALATAVAPSAHASFSNARIRDALGYRPWTPPATLPAHEAAADAVPAVTIEDERVPRHGVWQRFALRALAIRRTPMGRLLYRVTPEPVIDALKARLHG